ncbi:MAG TPA: FGGY family carbohydrate kinase [Polyangiaceae bacterium]|jgi:xylulokinase|nr:FGGY family carbohydrate kinase [Polyangiaceae bacterium]
MTSRGPLVVGVDVSTTAAKAVAFDAGGLALAEGRATFALSNPTPDAWEQRAGDWLSATHSAITELVSKLAPEARGSIGAVAIANQRETFVVTDEAGTPLAPAIVWMDARSRPEVAEVLRISGDEGRAIHQKSGKPACVTPSLYKLRAFFQRLHPELRAARGLKVLDVHGFVAMHLTGAFVTSTASADPLGIVDLARGTWDDELAALACIPKGALPELALPGTTLGAIRPEICKQLGLPEGTPLVAGAGDGQAAGLGAGVLDEGEAYLNIGTAVVSGVPSKTYRVDRAFRTLYAATPGDYLLETDLKGGTFTLDWLADRLLGSGKGDGKLEGGLDRMVKLADLEARAAKLPPMSDGLVALPYWAGVMSPHWDDDATGALIGLRGDHGPEHVFRALSEAIAFEQRLVTERVEAASSPIHKIVTVGGGGRRPFFTKLCATILGRPLTLCRAHETTALGAAMLAAPVAGLASSIREAGRAMSGDAETIEPGPERDLYDRAYRDVYVELYPALRRVTTALAAYRAAGTASPG